MANDDEDPPRRAKAPPQRRPEEYDYDDVKDSVLRNLLLRAGYDLNSREERVKFADDMAYLRDLRAGKLEDAALKEWIKAQQINVHTRTRFILWLAGGVALAIISAVTSNAVQLLKFFRQ
jgi:hypothetical protein